MNKPIVDFVGQDGNAFSLMGVWKRAARDAGWTKEQIDAVLAEAMAGDYDHLLTTLLANSHSDEQIKRPAYGGTEEANRLGRVIGKGW